MSEKRQKCDAAMDSAASAKTTSCSNKVEAAVFDVCSYAYVRGDSGLPLIARETEDIIGYATLVTRRVMVADR